MSETTLVGREELIAAITAFLADQYAQTLDGIRDSLERELDEAGPGSMARLGARLAEAGADWSFCPRDPLARRIHHVLADCILERSSAMFGMEHVAAVAGEPVVIFANHLSYSDANLLEVLLHRAGGAEIADRLTVMAGPKVYSSLKRRFSSLCFGTIMTPQNSALSSEDAVMNARDVARAARRSIQLAHERLRLGEALLVFAEGTRSRSRDMQQMLPGASRYLDDPGVRLLPIGITGTEAMFPIGVESLHPVEIIARAGRPLAAGSLRELAGGDRRLMMDVVGLAVAEQLPPEYRGAYSDDVTGLDDARRILAALD